MHVADRANTEPILTDTYTEQGEKQELWMAQICSRKDNSEAKDNDTIQ